MRVHFDQDSNAVYLRLDDSRIVESEEVWPGVVLDLNEHNQVVGVEILDAGKRVSLGDLTQMDFKVARQPGCRASARAPRSSGSPFTVHSSRQRPAGRVRWAEVSSHEAELLHRDRLPLYRSFRAAERRKP